MGLASGTRLGPYTITTPLGAGGMGEVYQATDTRLGRTVAIKVLPAHVAADPALRQRFEREARAISSLNHPHICTVHDVGSQDGVDFLVMEHLEGETLAARLARGALPIAQALQIAVQIADALDKAHRAGIVHRDLKPGNIMLTKSGAKLLDFGLAKSVARTLLGSRGEPDKAPPAVDPSAAPTITAPLTSAGSIVGTFQYMAPEQLEGQEADARTDIFAFGAVVYEMLTGRKAFEGKTQASLIAAILTSEPPPISTLQLLTPPSLDRVVRKCLAKEPDERWQNAGDLASELTWIASAEPSTPASVRASTGRRERIAWAAALAVVALAAVTAGMSALRPTPTLPEVRLDITTPPAPTADPASLAISPDGRKVVFSAIADGREQLWLRSLDSVSARQLAGTEGTLQFPFWSPDGLSVAFFADRKLKRINIETGSVEMLADAGSGRGGTWNRDGTIVFAPTAASALFRVASSGGKPVAVSTVQKPQQNDHRFPQFLPDGRHFIFYARGTPDGRGVYLGELDKPETRRLLDVDSSAVYVAGHLLFVREGTLFAQNFDADRLALSGEPFAVVEQVAINEGVSLGAVSASRDGAFVYRSGRRRTQFTWVDRAGKVLGTVGQPDDVLALNPSLSPDGRRLVLGRNVRSIWETWVLDVERGVLGRFPTGPGGISNSRPVWSSDGRVVLGTYLISPSGEEMPEKLPLPTITDFSRDGRFALSGSGGDLWALPLVGDRKAVPLFQTPTAEERNGQLSPDGHWVAYESNTSGRPEVFVRSFPTAGGQSQITSGGGGQVRWSRDGRELFYVAPDGRLMSVTLRPGADGRSLDVGTTVPLFAARIGSAQQGPNGAQYVVAADGRFLMNIVLEEPSSAPITVVLNWAPKPQ